MMMMYVYHVYASSLWRPKEVTDGMVVTVCLGNQFTDGCHNDMHSEN